jgi:heme-degrading monooxygenase HmoA
MYVLRNEAEVTLGRSDEFESNVEELAAILKTQPGYIGSTLLQSYGNPGRYTLISRWTDRDASRASARTDEFKAFARSLIGAGLIRPLRMTEAYESVFEIDADNANPNSSTCETLLDWSLNAPGLVPAFESFAREMAQLSKAHAPGFVSTRLRRFLGNETRYLTIAIASDRAAARARVQIPEIAAYLQAHPFTEFSVEPPAIDVCHVVKRYVGPVGTPMQAATAASGGSATPR